MNSAGCAYCGHPEDWHFTTPGPEVGWPEGMDCGRCSGSRPDMNRNWCDCSAFRQSAFPEGTKFERKIHGEWVAVCEASFSGHLAYLPGRLNGSPLVCL